MVVVHTYPNTDIPGVVVWSHRTVSQAAPARCAEARGCAAAQDKKVPMFGIVCPRSQRYNAVSIGLANAG